MDKLAAFWSQLIPRDELVRDYEERLEEHNRKEREMVNTWREAVTVPDSLRPDSERTLDLNMLVTPPTEAMAFEM